MQFARPDIQVVPPEGQQLASAQASGQLQQEELIHPLCLGLEQKPLDLLSGQHLHLLLFRRRQLAAQDGVFLDQAILDSPLQRHSDHMVAAAHRPLGHPRPLGVPVDLPTVGLHFVQKLLAVGLSQLVQMNVSQAGDYVDVDPLLVAFLCGGPDGGPAVGFIPVTDPVPKPHIRLDLEGLRCAAAVLQLFQLFQALRLGLGQYTFRFGLSVFIVDHDLPPLPAAILP